MRNAKSNAADTFLILEGSIECLLEASPALHLVVFIDATLGCYDGLL